MGGGAEACLLFISFTLFNVNQQCLEPICGRLVDVGCLTFECWVTLKPLLAEILLGPSVDVESVCDIDFVFIKYDDDDDNDDNLHHYYRHFVTIIVVIKSRANEETFHSQQFMELCCCQFKQKTMKQKIEK